MFPDRSLGCDEILGYITVISPLYNGYITVMLFTINSGYARGMYTHALVHRKSYTHDLRVIYIYIYIYI